MSESKIVLEDGKYTILYGAEKGQKFQALRYGEEWRDLTGDKMVYLLCCKVEELEEKLKHETIERQTMQHGLRLANQRAEEKESRLLRVAELVRDNAIRICDDQADKARTAPGSLRVIFCAERIKSMPLDKIIEETK
jgi:hypothetical protein